jgi:peptidoglycan hydrolase CwlO-like protein
MLVKGIKGISILIILCLFNLATFTYGKEVSFTQEDRDRIIRLEIKVEEGLKSVNRRIDDINKRIDDTNKRIDDTNKRIEEGLKSVNQRIDELRDFMLWGFGILFGGMGLLIGFVIWDRRTALAPAIRKNKELEEREEKLERALKELAEKDPKVAEILKHIGLL